MLFQNAAQLLYELPIAAGGNSMTKCWKMEQMLVEHVPCMVKTDRVYCRIFIVIKVAQKVIGITYFHQIWLVYMVGIAVITHFCLIGFSNIQIFQGVGIYSRQFYQQFANSLPIDVCSVAKRLWPYSPMNNARSRYLHGTYVTVSQQMYSCYLVKLLK